MTHLTLYGPNWSAYTRTVRLVLAEKNIEYELKEVDFSNGVMPAEHLNLHPFGKVPVLAHENFILYETSAICRYVDEAFDGPALQPRDSKRRGRMAQIISILDTYLSFEIRMGYVNELLFKPIIGVEPDEDRIKISRKRIYHAFGAVSDLVDSSIYLAGKNISLADLHAVPLFDYLAKTPEGNDLIDSQPILRQWWQAIKSRPSIINTEPDLTNFYPD